MMDDFGSTILTLLKSFDESEHYDYLIENLDVRQFLERCLCRVNVGTEDLVNENINNGVTIFGQLLSHRDAIISGKALKVLLPDILNQIDLNVLCTGFDVFDPDLNRKEMAARGEIYQHTLWALSNLAANQSLAS